MKPAITDEASNNTFDTAINLGPLSNSLSLDGSISDTDTDDYYQFEVTEPVNFSALLSNMAANGDIYLLDQSLSVISQSSQADTVDEAITTTLNAGTYYVRVNLSSSNPTSYQLQLTTTAMA